LAGIRQYKITDANMPRLIPHSLPLPKIVTLLSLLQQCISLGDEIVTKGTSMAETARIAHLHGFYAAA
jgi:hypothetical protein